MPAASLLLAGLLATTTAASFHLFGAPAHLTRRASATKFWGLDVSGGAGSISSPILVEHPKNVSELATSLEKIFNENAGGAPTWLLYSAIGIASRELTTRQVQEQVLPALFTDEETAPKARALERKLRANFDEKVQRVLKPAGYRNTETVIKRVLDAELSDLANSNIKDFDDVASHELTAEIIEAVQGEVDFRIQSTISEAVQLNKTAAERDLEEIFKRADADGNEVITFDELYELLSGEPIDPLVAPLAREWTILKTPRTAQTRWESWGSLLMAPQLRRLSTANAATRRLSDRLSRRMEELKQEFGDGAWMDAEWWQQDWIPSSRLSVNMPDADEEEDEEEDEATRAAGATPIVEGRWRKPWRWLRRH